MEGLFCYSEKHIVFNQRGSSMVDLLLLRNTSNFVWDKLIFIFWRGKKSMSADSKNQF